MKNWFIIPQSSKSILARVTNNNIEELQDFDIPFDSKSIITENGLVISICFELKSLKVFEIIGNLLNEYKDYNYSAIACKESTVYLGGKDELGKSFNSEGEVCSLIDFATPERELKTVYLPIESTKGKSIDDILILGNRLILVDNIVYPKYLFEYDIKEPCNPQHIGTRILSNHGTYEHIIRGDINDSWLVLFSSSVGQGGSSSHIAVSGKSNGKLSLHRPFFFQNGGDDIDNRKINKPSTFEDICLLGDYLFILKSDAFGYIDLNNKIILERFIELPTKLTNPQKIIKTPDNHLVLVSEQEYELIDTRVT